jgi:hypothetical protein
VIEAAASWWAVRLCDMRSMTYAVGSRRVCGAATVKTFPAIGRPMRRGDRRRDQDGAAVRATRAQRPIRAIGGVARDVSHGGRGKRPTQHRSRVGWDVEHAASRPRVSLQGPPRRCAGLGPRLRPVIDSLSFNPGWLASQGRLGRLVARTVPGARRRFDALRTRSRAVRPESHPVARSGPIEPVRPLPVDAPSQPA